MKVVILAGGEGKRLRPLTDNVPKPLVEINGRAIIDHQMDMFRNLGLDSFVVLAGYKSDVLKEHFKIGYDWADVSFSVESRPLGTGGSIKAAEKQIDDEQFIVMNGDVMTNIDVSMMLKGNEDLIGKIALVEMFSPYGVVSTDGRLVRGFIEKPLLNDVWINAGIYWFSKSVFDYLPGEGSIETLTFPILAKNSKLGFYKSENKDKYWRSIDTLKDYEEIESRLKAIK